MAEAEDMNKNAHNRPNDILHKIKSYDNLNRKKIPISIYYTFAQKLGRESLFLSFSLSLKWHFHKTNSLC